ncbi:MAG: hypothetical protein COA67_10815 [Lutibacter sp.]|nr:MAG: hypothetical protein COA67_10815 [Lutibacter sp.]
MIMKNKRLVIILLTPLFLLLIPLVAMQFTDQVNWSLFDFVIGGLLLFGTGIIFEFILRKIKKTNYRIALCGLLLIVLLLIWAELAVGIFGSPFSGK